MKQQTKGSLILLLAAFIWGTAFVAQDLAAGHIGPMFFNCVRSLLGGLVLLPVIFVMGKVREKKNGVPKEKMPFWKDRNLLIGGICCGVVLFFAVNLQQLGIERTTAGKAAFITALYIIFVPVFGLFFGKKPSVWLWISIFVAILGMFFLCVMGETGFGIGDLAVLGCSLCYACHIMVVDHFAPKTDGVKLSCIQFFTVFLLSLPFSFILETPSAGQILECWGPIVFTGVMSSGVAYTLQIIGQQNTPAAVAPVVMSMESVFAALTDLVVLGTGMDVYSVLGCVLIFGAVLLAQKPEKQRE